MNRILYNMYECIKCSVQNIMALLKVPLPFFAENMQLNLPTF